jgi:hypothetical protein
LNLKNFQIWNFSKFKQFSNLINFQILNFFQIWTILEYKQKFEFE